MLSYLTEIHPAEWFVVVRDLLVVAFTCALTEAQ